MMADVLIIGAGPAGLAMAAQCQMANLSYHLIDHHGTIGGSYARLWPAISLASPTKLTRLPGDLEIHDRMYVTVGEYLAYLQRYADNYGIEVHTTTCERLFQRRDKRWQFETLNGPVEDSFGVVVAATGMVSFPVQPTYTIRQPITFEHMHSSQWRGPQDAWSTVVVVGAGTSAVEVAEACSNANIEVFVSTRKGKVKTLPKTALGRDLHDFLGPLEALPRFAFLHYCRQHPTVLGTDMGFGDDVKSGKITICGPIAHLTGHEVHFKSGQTVKPDVLIDATGFQYQTNYLPADVVRYPHAPKTSSSGESVSHQGLFFLGMPCVQGVSSEYLRGIAHDAPRLCEVIVRRLK